LHEIYASSSSDDNNEYLNVQINEFFKKPVPPFITNYLDVKKESPPFQQDFDFLDIVKAPPANPAFLDRYGASFWHHCPLALSGMDITSLQSKKNYSIWS
jgi:hypothetical protein